MIRRQRSAFVGLAVLAFVSPAFAEAPPPDAKPEPDVAWLLIGIQPATARLEIDEPRLKQGVVWSFHYNLSSYSPVDGFILVKAQPGTIYGVAASSLMKGKSIFGVRYKPCGKVPTFKAEAGKVAYITTIAYRSEGATFDGLLINMAESATYSQDLEGARAFLKTHYPGLSDSLEQGAYEMTPVGHECR